MLHFFYGYPMRRENVNWKQIVKRMKMGLFLGILLVGLGACSTQEELIGNDDDFPTLVSFETVGKGALFGGGQEGISEMSEVIRTAEEWLKLKEKMNSVNMITKEFQDKTLDFEREMILVCFDKLRGSGGYEIEFADVQESKTEIIAIIRKKGPSEMAASVMTQPFHIIKIPGSAKKVVFTLSE